MKGSFIYEKRENNCWLFNAKSWGCRIHRLHLCKRVRPPPQEHLGYDINPSNGKALVLKL